MKPGEQEEGALLPLTLQQLEHPLQQLKQCQAQQPSRQLPKEQPKERQPKEQQLEELQHQEQRPVE